MESNDVLPSMRFATELPANPYLQGKASHFVEVMGEDGGTDWARAAWTVQNRPIVFRLSMIHRMFIRDLGGRTGSISLGERPTGQQQGAASCIRTRLSRRYQRGTGAGSSARIRRPRTSGPLSPERDPLRLLPASRRISFNETTSVIRSTVEGNQGE